MAERRMFAKTIIDSDAFLDMPLSTQALYFHLSMRADDEGFVNNPKKIARMIGADDDSLKLLVMKKFILPFDSGVVVIKHWRIHNYIQKDRFKETVYKDERSQITLKENGAYTQILDDVSNMDTKCIQNASSLEPQVRLGKDRLGKERQGESEETAHAQLAPVENVESNDGDYVELKNFPLVKITKEELRQLRKLDLSATRKSLDSYFASMTVQLNKGRTYGNHFEHIRKWAMQDGAKISNSSIDSDVLDKIMNPYSA